jgi:hypothetical protein
MRFVYVIKPENILNSYVTDSGFETVGSVAARLSEFNLVINADGWYGAESASIWYSNEKAVNKVQMHYRPWLNFDKDNNFSFGWKRGSHWGNYNAVSGVRFIVEDGEVNSRMSDSGELNARTAVGITNEGELVIVVVDGRDTPNPEGLSLTGLAELMIENGCHTAIDLDGGGSTTLAVNGEVVNNPNDDGVAGERPVINHLCLDVIFEDIPDPPPIEPPSDERRVLLIEDEDVTEFVPKV